MKARTQPKLDLAAINLDDAYSAFWQSRRAMNVSSATLDFYTATTSRFISWVKKRGICDPEQVTSREVTDYLAEIRDTGASDNTIHAHARAIRTLLIYWYEEKLTPERVRFPMPKIGDVDHKVLSYEELAHLLSVCPTARDRAIVSFMVDTGARRQEVANLVWEDVDLGSGAVHIVRGKGRKSRWVGMSPITLRYIYNYRKERKPDIDARSPVFVSRDGSSLTGQAILLMFRRLSKLAGFHVHPHILRHTYATNANSSGMSLFDIQQTMGHADASTTERYIKSLPSHIIETQIKHSLIMKLSHRRKK